jgi:hypothetical protein
VTDKILDSVLDVTVAYPQDIVHSEAELGKGVAPQAVHFYARNHAASALPNTPDQLEAWCRTLWKEKEARLGQFYDNQKTFVTNGEKAAVSEEKEASIRLLMYCVLVFWVAFLLWVGWSLVFFPLFKWYCIVSALFFVFIGRSYGGVDSLLYSSLD